MKIKKNELKVKVLLLISGSIAAVRIPLLASELAKSNFEVKCVISKNAEKIIQPLALSTLSRNACVLDNDQWSYYQNKPLHIDLCDWADILIMAPLTATTLSKWATGNADGILSSILIANKKPIIVAPAMNTRMWLNQAVQKNYSLLKNYPNTLFLNPSSGILACDDIGIGKMVSNDLIKLALNFLLIQNKNQKYNDLSDKSFLITGGCTSEKIDAARNITNDSSGTMGLLLAQIARFRGAKVKYIHGPLKNCLQIKEGIENFEVKTSEELTNAIKENISNYDFFLMNAAVSDFRVCSDGLQKIPKKQFKDYLNNNLEIVPDILNEVRKLKKHNQVFVGFCAFSGPIKKARNIIQEKMINKGCDLLFANPIDIEGQGFGSLAENEGWLFNKTNTEIHIEKTSKIELANRLINEIISINK